MQRIILFEGKAKEKKETLATLFGERMLGSMPSDEVGIAPADPPQPRPSAYRRADRGIIRPFRGGVPRCHNGVCQHHDPSHHDMTWTERYWIDSDQKEETFALLTGDIPGVVIC